MPKNKIRLSRHLRAQTTPYPEAYRWLRLTVFFAAMLLIIGIYFFARPDQNTAANPEMTKHILGEQSAEETEIYQVRSGDTLFAISEDTGVFWQTLAELNDLEEPYILKPGQELMIPK